MTDPSSLAHAVAHRDGVRNALDTNASLRASEHHQQAARQAVNRVDELRYQPFRVREQRLREQRRILSGQLAGLQHQLGQHRCAMTNLDAAVLAAMGSGADPAEAVAARDTAEAALRQTERDLATTQTRLGGVNAALCALTEQEAEHVVSGRAAPGTQL